jgi:tetratricopeptide (TPR) repeat protein
MALARAGLGFDFGTADPDLEALLEEALDALPATETDHRARLLGARVSNAAAAGDLRAVSRLGRTALRLAEIIDQPALAATAQLSWRMANWRRDLLAERLRADRAALAGAERAGSTGLELTALLYGTVDLFESGRTDDAEAWFERFSARARLVRQPVYDSFALTLDATSSLLRGDYDRAQRLADEALELGRQSHGANAVQGWMANVLVRAWDRGQLGALADIAARAVADFTAQPTWHVVHGMTLVAAGRADDARPLLETLVGRDSVTVNDDSLWATGVGLLVEIARALGDVRAGHVLAATLRPYAGRWVVAGLGRACLGPVARFAGVAAHLAGDLEAADDLLGTAVGQSRALSARPHLARSLQDRARLLRDRRGAGDAQQADAAMAEAERIASDIGLDLRPLGS